MSTEEKNVKEVGVDATAAEPTSSNQSPMDMPEPEEPKLSFGQKVKKSFMTPGSALQIITAAVLGIAIGLIVSTQVDNVPEAAIEILNIPGDLWLRALKAVGKSSLP